MLLEVMFYTFTSLILTIAIVHLSNAEPLIKILIAALLVIYGLNSFTFGHSELHHRIAEKEFGKRARKGNYDQK